MIWLVVLIIPIVLFTLERLLWWKNKEYRGIGIFFGCIVLFTFGSLAGGWTINNYISYPQHKAFYEVNAQNYAITVDETSVLLSQEKYISEALIPIEGSIEKTELAKTISDRIVEWRDAVNLYNQTIASLQYLDNTIWFGCMIPDEVHELKMLSIGE